MNRIRTRVPRIAFAGVVVLAGCTLAGCAQVPTSEQVSTCHPADWMAIERTGGGSGPVVQDGGVAEYTFRVVTENGREVIPETALKSDANGNPTPTNVDDLKSYGLQGVLSAMQCAQSGETVTATMNGESFFNDLIPAENDAERSGKVTVTVNVKRVYHSAATGAILPQQNGIPAVVNAPDGTPGVTMPNEAAPTELRGATTIRGNGPQLAENDLVTLHFSAFTWSDAGVIRSTFGSDPVQVKIGGTNDGLFGATEQLKGIPVGSQRVVILPAATIAELSKGYTPVGNGDAVVLVMDVLGSDPAAAQQ